MTFTFTCITNTCPIGATGEMMYWIMWEAVRRLEECDLKVIIMLYIQIVLV